MRKWHASEEVAFVFDEDSPFTQPAVEVLMPRVQQWPTAFPDLAAFYTPEEFEDQPFSPMQPHPKQPAKKVTLSGSAKAKRHTTASLAAELRTVVDFLPKLSQQMDALAQRQQLVESKIVVPISIYRCLATSGPGFAFASTDKQWGA